MQSKSDRMKTYSEQTEFRFEGLQSLDTVVDQGKTSRSTTAKSVLEAKNDNLLLILDFVHLSELLLQNLLGNVGLSLVNDFNDLLIEGLD